MSMVGLTLASLLAFTAPPELPAEPSADPAPSEDVIMVVTPAPEPAPAPAPAPAPTPAPPPSVPDWGPQADVVVSVSPAPRPVSIAPMPQAYVAPPKPMMGIGLLVGSAIAFTVGLSARVGQVDVAVSHCRTWPDHGFSNRTQCFDYFDPPLTDTNDLFVGFAYGSSMVLNMIGSGAMGQHAAWQSVHGDGRVRKPGSRTVFGAIFTGLGIASIGAHYALIYADAKNPCVSWDCNVERRALWIAASDGGAAMLNVGLGLFSWSSNYRRNLEGYQRMRWTLIPGVTPGSLGATAGLQF